MDVLTASKQALYLGYKTLTNKIWGREYSSIGHVGNADRESKIVDIFSLKHMTMQATGLAFGKWGTNILSKYNELSEK